MFSSDGKVSLLAVFLSTLGDKEEPPFFAAVGVLATLGDKVGGPFRFTAGLFLFDFTDKLLASLNRPVWDTLVPSRDTSSGLEAVDFWRDTLGVVALAPLDLPG